MNSLKTLNKRLHKIFGSICLPHIRTTDLEGNAPSQTGLETIYIIVLVLITLWIYYFQSILLLFAHYLGLFELIMVAIILYSCMRNAHLLFS